MAKSFKTQLRELKKATNNKLTKSVITDLLSYSNDSDDIKSHASDVLKYGCQSGTVGMLIYYTDTTAFFKKYKKEIMTMLKELLNDCGYKSPSELFGDKFDNDDYFMEDTQNQNLMAWFGYEETVRYILDSLQVEY